MRSMLRDGSTAGLLAIALVATPLSGQANPDSVKLRNDCRLAEQVLTTGEPGPQRTEALKIIGLCGGEATPTLVLLWSSAGDDRAEVELLVTATRAFVAAPVVDALFSTLTPAGRPLNARVAALLVLLTYADPSVLPGFDAFVGDSTRLLRSFYGHIDHPFPVVGRESLPQPVTDRLRTALQTIAASDPDARMRVAARVALQNAPLTP
jgi:hypothetical protein